MDRLRSQDHCVISGAIAIMSLLFCHTCFNPFLLWPPSACKIMSIIHVHSNEDLAAKENSQNGDLEVNEKTGAKLEKSIGLLSSITIIVGSVIGSGIFVSPSGILHHTNSFGASIVIWILCGVFSLLGAYCYAELGSMMPRSGADYSYVLEAFGPFFGFLRLWIEVLVARPTSAAVIAMVFAQYILQPVFPDCPQPDSALRMLASVCVLLVGLINCMSVRWSTRTQDVFTFAKVAALILIIITGFVQIGRGRTETYQDSFEGSNWNPGSLTVAFYTGLFAYSGWNYLNSMIEEMKNARRDLPIAIIISCVMITAVYTIANVAYASVLSVHEILESSAVAVTFAKKVYGPAWFIMPIFVAFSTFGGVNGTIMTTSRIYFVASQENQMPKLLSFLHVDRLTPIPAVIFTCVATLIYIAIGDVNSLIAYLGFVQWMAIGVSVFIVILFRFTRPEMERPVKASLFMFDQTCPDFDCYQAHINQFRIFHSYCVKAPIVFAVIFVGVTAFLVIFAFVGAPTESLIGVLIIALGIPVYILGCVWKNKPKSFTRFILNGTIGAQKLWRLVPGI
ncbi:uncharacterized protein DEA37_0000481 [Paragonimus westermani]|uniref:Uncharacterized protein n=2 Tax=Paragonimus westermani TaxID=34504 RepID=A0A5J4NE97_9TREM|nr:uncharacterized protein DEA37_0000481 [Paragonimus westermani]